MFCRRQSIEHSYTKIFKGIFVSPEFFRRFAVILCRLKDFLVISITGRFFHEYYCSSGILFICARVFT